jgi:hypothetical protein
MILARTAAASLGEAGEGEGAAVLLASPAADSITGVTRPADGGHAIS